MLHDILIWRDGKHPRRVKRGPCNPPPPALPAHAAGARPGALAPPAGVQPAGEAGLAAHRAGEWSVKFHSQVQQLGIGDIRERNLDPDAGGSARLRNPRQVDRGQVGDDIGPIEYVRQAMCVGMPHLDQTGGQFFATDEQADGRNTIVKTQPVGASFLVS